MSEKIPQPPKPAGSGNGGIIPPISGRFKPGQSGNPAGRPNAGAVLKEWFNEMTKYTALELQEVLDDPDAPRAKVAAARRWLLACSEDRTVGGVPLCGDAQDAIADRCDGKPRQPIEQTISGEPFVIQILGGPAPKD
jgi:hypothetical protein